MIAKRIEIVFLDDEPRACGDLIQILEDTGYLVHVVTSYAQADPLINDNPVRLLIHGTLRTKTHWECCDRILARYPDLPVLHARPPGACLDHELEGTRFSDKYELLTDLSGFLRKVQHLIELSHVHEQEKFRQRTGAKLKRWSGEFTSLDLDSTFSTTASFLQREFSASGVIWIPIARIKEINDSFPKNGEELFQPHPAAFENLQVWSDRESIDWVALLSDWHTHQSFDGRKKPSHPWSFQREREMDVIIPITDICDKQLVGFLVLVDAQGWNVFVDDSFLEEVMNILCRQWSFCRDFESVSLKVFCDDLTPLYNQRYLPVVLQQELVRSNRTTEPFSVLFMDIDYFKQVNDTLGHLVGSRVLVSLSRVLLDSLRGTDFGFRYGGDEFVAVLSGTGQDGAKFLAERLRNKVENTVFEELGHKVRITVSVGVATYPHHASSVAEVLWMADQAMYSGKNSGRNTVYIAS